jgi:CheY-like chemotaxis protein
LPDLRGEEVLRELTHGEQTRTIPVVVATAEALSARKRERLSADAAAVFSKSELDRDTFARVLASLPAAQSGGTAR